MSHNTPYVTLFLSGSAAAVILIASVIAPWKMRAQISSLSTRIAMPITLPFVVINPQMPVKMVKAPPDENSHFESGPAFVTFVGGASAGSPFGAVAVCSVTSVLSSTCTASVVFTSVIFGGCPSELLADSADALPPARLDSLILLAVLDAGTAAESFRIFSNVLA